MNEDSTAWQAYAEIHRSTDPQSIDSSLARDEALGCCFDDVLACSVADDGQFVPRRFQSLCRNRFPKQLRRREIDAHRFAVHRGGAAANSEPLRLYLRRQMHSSGSRSINS